MLVTSYSKFIDLTDRYVGREDSKIPMVKRSVALQYFVLTANATTSHPVFDRVRTANIYSCKS